MANAKVSLSSSEDSSDVEEQTKTRRRARALAHAMKGTKMATEEQLSPDSAHSDAPEPPPEPVLTGPQSFPHSTIGAYDNETLSCGLFVHYGKFMGGAQDVFKQSQPYTAQEPRPGHAPSFKKILSWVFDQLVAQPQLRTASTLVITSDSRSLQDIEHWRHTSRWLVERTKYRGPDKDHWHALLVPSNLFDAHFVWTAVYVLKALVPFLMSTDFVLFDRDAAFTALFENRQ